MVADEAVYRDGPPGEGVALIAPGRSVALGGGDGRAAEHHHQEHGGEDLEQRPQHRCDAHPVDAGVTQEHGTPVEAARCELGSVREIVIEMRAAMLKVHAHKDLSIAVQVESAARFIGDRADLTEALGNLLDNAYKYTPEGGRIGIRLARSADSIEVQVRDSGPGIPLNERKNVFKRFYRLDKHRGTKGTGLGLSLVAAVCKVHRATIELDHDHGLLVKIAMPVDHNATDAESENELASA